MEPLRSKRDLRDYILHSVSDDDPLQVEGIADGVMARVFDIMGPYLHRCKDDALRQYYEPVLLQVRDAFRRQDYDRLSFELHTLAMQIGME